MKSLRERMEIVNAYEAVGTYRGAAALCGTTHKTVKRVLERRQAGQLEPRVPPPSNTAGVEGLIAKRVEATDGRISAKRLLPVARKAGYIGSARNSRRAVAAAKATWKRRRRTYRPWIPVPGEHLIIDWAEEGDRNIFCAVLAWSRYRFVRFGADQTRTTTLALLADCFEELGGIPAVVLTDRMACLKAGIVANVVVPHPEYVQFATHYRFRPDFCEGADPESKGVVENLCGYAQRDLLVPAWLEPEWPDLAAANAAARVWCAEVNGQVHSEICAVPAERLVTEREVRSVPESVQRARVAVVGRSRARACRRHQPGCGVHHRLPPRTGGRGGRDGAAREPLPTGTRAAPLGRVHAGRLGAPDCDRGRLYRAKRPCHQPCAQPAFEPGAGAAPGRARGPRLPAVVGARSSHASRAEHGALTRLRDRSWREPSCRDWSPRKNWSRPTRSTASTRTWLGWSGRASGRWSSC